MIAAAGFSVLPDVCSGGKGEEVSSYQTRLAPFSREEREIYGVKMRQPYVVDVRSIQESMRSLKYQTKSFFWSEALPVFDSEQIRNLSPLIQKRLSVADASQKAIFRILGASGQPAIQGDAFISRKGLNWRFNLLNGVKRKVGDFNIFGGGWKIAGAQNFKYKTRKFFFFFNKKITNWVVSRDIRPISRLAIKPVSPSETGTVKNLPSLSSEEIENRLQVLKELKDENLIDDKDYESKRREILQSF